MAAAAEQALPGEMLYPIKRGIERAQAELSVSPGGKGLDLLHQAEDRLTEVEGLLASDAVEAEAQVPATLEDFTAQAAQGADLLMSEYGETRDARDIVEVREFTTGSIDTLADLARSAPASTQDEFAAAATTLREIDAAAIELCDTCAAGIPALEMPALFRASADASRALTEVDHRALDNSHPVEVDKNLMARADKLAGSAEDSSGQNDQATGEGGGNAGPQAPGVPGGEDLDDTPLTGEDGPIKKLGDGLKTGSKPVDDTVDGATDTLDGAVEDVTEGLGGAVETILPDPQGGGSLLP